MAFITRRRFSGNPSSAIYGTIVVAGLLAAEGDSGRSVAGIVASIAGTLAVFWLAHAYSRLLGVKVVEARSATQAFRGLLREEWPIVESGALPSAALVVARAAGASRPSAVLVALILSVAELGVWSTLVCRRMELSAPRTLFYALAAGLLGGGIIALKAAVH